MRSTSIPTCLGQANLNAEGQIEGWCWYPDLPLENAVVDLVVNGRSVRGAKAARMRSDLGELGIENSKCGFVFAMPRGALPDGRRTVIEVRERRMGQVIGRIIVGRGDPVRKARLAAIASALDATGRSLHSLEQIMIPELAGPMEELGWSLSQLSHDSRSHVQSSLYPSLPACIASMAAIPRADLGLCAAPRVSIVIGAMSTSAGCNLAELAGTLRDAACLLQQIGAEFILLDDCERPLTVLLPTRMRHLQLVCTEPAHCPGGPLNAAALVARGTWLAFAQPDRLGIAGLAEACLAANEGVVYFDSAFVPVGTASDWLPRHHGLQCLLARDVFAAIGGFDPTLGEAEMWADVLDKTRMLGLSITGWIGCRPARILRMPKHRGARHA